MRKYHFERFVLVGTVFVLLLNTRLARYLKACKGDVTAAKEMWEATIRCVFERTVKILVGVQQRALTSAALAIELQQYL